MGTGLARRAFLAAPAAAFLAPAPGRPRPAADPGLAAAAAELGRCLDRLAALQPRYDYLCDEDPGSTEADVERFEADRWEPAERAMRVAETRLLDRLDAAGLDAVIAGGRILGRLMSRSVMGLDAWPESLTVLDLAAVATD